MSDTTPKGAAKPATPMTLAKLVDMFGPWLIAVPTLILWELYVQIFNVPKFVLPAPTAIIASLWKWAPVIAVHAWQTLFTTLVGFFFAVLGGLSMASLWAGRACCTARSIRC